MGQERRRHLLQQCHLPGRPPRRPPRSAALRDVLRGGRWPVLLLQHGRAWRSDDAGGGPRLGPAKDYRAIQGHWHVGLRSNHADV
eukprot:5911316-Pyramimonas_sp.AAC.1